MRAVLCIDIEPEGRQPAVGGVTEWQGATRLLSDGWLRDEVRIPVVNWYLRIDHQIEVLHGTDTWALTRFSTDLERALDAGDEVGVHPHDWRVQDGRWIADGSDAWALENAERALDGFRAHFGVVPASARYGDRLVSDAVVALFGREGVLVDLTLEPGAPACRSLVPGDDSVGIIRHVDPRLARRYRPSVDSVDVPDPNGALTMVPLTTALVPGTGAIDTLQLWREPGEFAAMLATRLFDPDLDHLAFAIRSDLRILPWAVTNVEHNVEELTRRVPGIEWVRASDLALDGDEGSAEGLGIVGSLGRQLTVLEGLNVDRTAEVARLRSDLDAREHELALAVESTSAAARRADEAEQRVARLESERDAVESTLVWRGRTRLLPLLRPLARVRRSVAMRWSQLGGRLSDTVGVASESAR